MDLSAPVSRGTQPGKLHLGGGLFGRGLRRLLGGLGGLGGGLVCCEGRGGESEDETEAEGDADELFHLYLVLLEFSTTDSSSEDHTGDHMNHPLRHD